VSDSSAERPPDIAADAVFRSAILKTFAGQLGFSALSFAGSLLTARLLGPSGRGELAILILVPSLFVAALELGQESTTSHLVARAQETRGAVHANAALYCLVLTPLACVLVGGVLWLLDVVSGPILLAGIAGGVAVGAGIYIRVLSGLALGIGRVALYNTVRLLLAASLPVGVVLLALAGIQGAMPFFYAWCVGNLAVAALFALILTPLFARPRPRLAIEQAKIGLPIHVATLSQFLLLRADQLILFVLATSAAVGRYSIAVNIVEVLWYLPAAAGLVSIPFLSGSRTEDEKTAALLHALRLSLWLTAGGAVLVALVAPLLVPLVFGNAFRPAIWPLELLLPGIVMAGIVRVCSAALIAKRQTAPLWKITVVALTANLVFCFILIPPFAAAGAAVASSLAYALLGMLLLRKTVQCWALWTVDCVRLPRRIPSNRWPPQLDKERL
jgi:O-antigen/teichoic acid export membrane protein